jgi:hypothetical protein
MNPAMKLVLAFTSLLALAAAPHALAADDWRGLPARRPEFGVKFQFTLRPLVDSTGTLAVGEVESGQFAVVRPTEFAEELQLTTTYQARLAGGARGDAVGSRLLRITKDRDAIGGALPEDVPADVLRRLLDESDVALLPLRLVTRHKMPSSTGSAPAIKEVAGASFHTLYSERFAGLETVSRTTLQKFRGRTVRTFRPSGYRLVDHFLTYEDTSDDTIMAAYGVRVLQHPKRAGTGIVFATRITVSQIDWLREKPIIDEEYWEEQEERFAEILAEDLYESISGEGIGDPFGSPSAAMLRQLHLLTPTVLTRITSRVDAKSLAAIAPIVVDQPVAYDGSRFDEAFDKAVDPAARLLLAAAATAAAGDPKRRTAYLADATIALHSQDAGILRAAFLLARTLADPSLVAPLAAAIARAEEPLAAHGALALGAIGGEAAVAALKTIAAARDKPLLAAAATRGLADTGEPAVEAIVGTATTLAALDVGSGDVVIVDEGARVGPTLVELTQLAGCLRTGKGDDAFRRFVSLQAARGAKDRAARAPAIASAILATRFVSVVDAFDPDLLGGTDAPLLRRVVSGSGRACVPALLARLRREEGEAKIEFAKLVGATRDPRVRDFLREMSDSEDEAASDAGSAGLVEFQKGS